MWIVLQYNDEWMNDNNNNDNENEEDNNNDGEGNVDNDAKCEMEWVRDGVSERWGDGEEDERRLNGKQYLGERLGQIGRASCRERV